MDGQVGIIAIEIMSISSRIAAETLLKDEMCDEICRMLIAHGWEKFVLVSHSWVFFPGYAPSLSVHDDIDYMKLWKCGCCPSTPYPTDCAEDRFGRVY